MALKASIEATAVNRHRFTALSDTLVLIPAGMGREGGTKLGVLGKAAGTGSVGGQGRGHTLWPLAPFL